MLSLSSWLLPGRGRIFVAGHNGMLGSALTALLRQNGCEHLLLRTRTELDLADGAAVMAFFRAERPDVVFLCAGLTGGIQANRERPASFLHENLAIQDAVFEAARLCGARQVVFFGSSCTYPRDAGQPIPEDSLGAGLVEPTSAAYAAAKTAGIIACAAYNQQYPDTHFIALVPNSLYGPGDHFDPATGHVLAGLLARFHAARRDRADSVTLWGTGRPRREFLHVADAARAALFAVSHVDRLENRHYNIGTGVDLSIAELAQRVAQVVGFSGEIRWDARHPDGAARKLLDSSRFRALGWAPEVPLEAGLMQTYEWYVNRLAES